MVLADEEEVCAERRSASAEQACEAGNYLPGKSPCDSLAAEAEGGEGTRMTLRFLAGTVRVVTHYSQQKRRQELGQVVREEHSAPGLGCIKLGVP